MKKLSIYLLLIALFVFPFTTFAKESKYLGETYETLNFEETLEKENIEKKYDSYKETSDQIPIYMFRGDGCGFCQAFLTFLSENADEYGKYFKLVSFEVWNDQKNSELMGYVATYLDQPANGVPFIVIGDKSFLGFDENAYGESIKEAIKNLYNTSKKDRYDVFEKMKANPKKWKNAKKQDNTTTTSVEGGQNSTLIIVLADFIFTLCATVVIIFYINKKFNEKKAPVEKVEKKETKSKKK